MWFKFTLTEIFREEKCLELAFEGSESSMMSWGRLFQMWGPTCEKVQKPWVLRLKRQILSMRVSDEERREREGL